MTHPSVASFVRLVDVHGDDPHADRGRAEEVARYLSPDREVLAVTATDIRCAHGFPVWAVELSGPDHRVDYVPGLSGPHLPHITS